MELIINFINGKFRVYTEVLAPNNYCFYDFDEEQRHYINRIETPLLDEEEIKRKFVLVEGNAEELNAKLQEELNKDEYNH